MRAYDIWIADFPFFEIYFPTTDGQVQLDVPLGEDLLLQAGINLRYAHMHCDQYYPSDVSELRGAGFVHAQWTLWDVLQLTGGLRLDLSTKVEPEASPRAVVVYRPVPYHSFRLGYGLAFRKPSLYESHVHGVVENYNPATPEIVEKMKTSFGNENLTNEKMHSFELGWRGWALDERLQLTVDLFFNLYIDTIRFMVDVKERMGAPDLRNSEICYENDPGVIQALGGEAEVKWRFDDHWSVWGNLGLRRVTYQDTGERVPAEPTFRANLGGRYSSTSGFSADVALHYVSSYAHPYTDPDAIFEERIPVTLGDDWILLGRAGYQMPLGPGRSAEIGFSIRTPLGNPHREYPGSPMSVLDKTILESSWGGEIQPRMLNAYLRGMF